MKYKKSLLIICLIICLFSIASVAANDLNETGVSDDSIKNEDNKLKEVDLDKTNEFTDDVGYTNDFNENGSSSIKSIEVLSLENDEDILTDSPPASAYSVSVSGTTINYGSSGTISMSVMNHGGGYTYNYDFYLKIYDSNKVEKINQRFFGTNPYGTAKYTINAFSLDMGTYTLKIVNQRDGVTMKNTELIIKSIPSSDYSVSVSDITIDYGSSGTIPISISAAKNYYYKYDFYIKIYDSSGVEKISKRYYSTSSSSQQSYNIASNSLAKGVYSIKIFNNYDKNLMSSAKLTIKSPYPPANAYSVSISDTLMNYGEKGLIEMSIIPAYSYTYKHDFYLKVYDSNGVEKINKRFYTKGFYYSETYNISANSLNYGIYTIMIINKEDNQIMDTAKLTVTKLVLETQNLTVNCNEDFEYKIRASENNIYKSGLNVIVTCNNKKYSINTNDEGYVTLNMHLTAGTYEVYSQLGNVIKQNSIRVNSVYVANIFKDVYVNSFKGYYNGKNTINYGWKGNLEGYFKIFKGNKLVYQTKFNSNGNIYDYFKYINYNKHYAGAEIKKVGTFSSVITDAHGNILAKATIHIKKASPKLSISKKTFNVNLKTKKIKITLKDSNGAIKRVKLTLKIKSKVYKAKTNSKGVATFKVKKISKKGTYKINVKFKGNKNYNKVSKNFKISVKKVKKSSTKKKTTKKSNTKKTTSSSNKKSTETYKFNVPHADAKVTVKVYTGNKYNTYVTQTNWLGNGEVLVTETSGVEHKVLLEVQYYDDGFKVATYEGMSFFLR